MNNSGCPTNQVCTPVANTIQQCYWAFPFSGDGKLESNGTTTLPISTSPTGSNAIIASGKFIVKTSCDGNGNCLSGNGNTPASLIEYTFQNNNDFYDVSYLNGINTPVTMFPVPATNLDYQSSDPYRCMAAGGDTATIQDILDFQNVNHIRGNGDLKPFACASNYDSIFVNNLTGFNFVYSTTTPTTCTSSTGCVGKTCGLSLTSVLALSTQLTCGDRIGYWSYAQFCAANPDYSNSSLGIDCGNPVTRAYAMCKDQPQVLHQPPPDQGPGRSCFNSSTTFAGNTCCGFEAWTLNGAPQPASSTPVSGVNTSYWVANILPAVKPIKEGCPLAYSYQFDDAYSTFTCATTGTPKNQTDYKVTLCPGNNNAGIAPPEVTCTIAPGSGGTFQVNSPDNLKIKAGYNCNASGCVPLNPTSTVPGIVVFTPQTGVNNYQITATSQNNKVQQCTFSIPPNACIGRVGSGSPCSTWQLPTGGRSIDVPQFDNPPSCTRATVPTGQQSKNFTVGIPSGITLTVFACNSTSGLCNSKVNPSTGAAIFTTQANISDYLLTAKQTTGTTVSVSCKFSIPERRRPPRAVASPW